MNRVRNNVAACIGIGLALFMTACGSGTNTPPPPPTTYVLTVSSTNPASGVAIGVSPADVNAATSGNTSFTRTYDSGAAVTLTAPTPVGGNNFVSWSGCASASAGTCMVTMNANTTVTANYTATPVAPTVTVTPASSSITTAQALAVTVSVSGTPTPTGSVVLTSGSYTSAATTLSSDAATINIPAGSLAAGSDTLKVTYTPDSTSSPIYISASGTNSVTVTAIAPTVTVTPASSSVTTEQALAVTVAVSGTPTPTGSVVLTSGSYTSSATTLSSGGATINIPAGSLVSGADSLKVTYTPDSASSPIYASGSGTNSVTVTATAPTVTVTPASSSITTAQALSVAITVTGTPTPTGSVTLTSGSYTSAATTLSSGAATINVPAGSLATGSDTLKVTYTPDSASSPIYTTNTGTSSVTVTLPAKTTPTVTVTPASSGITSAQALVVTVALSGSNGTPTGSVVLTSGSYTSAAATLSSGGATINIPAGSLATGSDTLTVAYTPDSASSSLYNTATGTSTVTVTAISTVSVNQTNAGPAVTDQLLGMNMAVWDNAALSAAVAPFQTAGIKAVRWPGGSTSDTYHWEGVASDPSSPSICPSGYAFPNDTFADFVSELAVPAGLDIALTANYGSNTACNGGGEPSEAAAWVANALTLGVTVSHMTVGNEEYGSWEYDLHAKKNDPPTFTSAVAGTSGYYALIKAASPQTLVGVEVEPNYAPWDEDVMSGAPYDFVEYHYYPETPGAESDSSIVHSAAQALTTNINKIKSELTKWGTPNTPIYVGEIGGPYSNPGKQSWSITQGLYAGQVLGEMMNDGVTRLTWWIGFGNCNGDSGFMGSSTNPIYGWQDFGAYNVFSDGTADSTCPGAGALGSLSPTAEAFELFSNVAVTGENALTATVAGDTADVRAYAATHSGGTALVLFNLNETISEPVVVTLSAQSTATTVTVETYDKAIYDLSGSPTGVFPDPAGTSTWAPPTTTTISSPTLPLSLTLAPWSMNVVTIH